MSRVRPGFLVSSGISLTSLLECLVSVTARSRVAARVSEDPLLLVPRGTVRLFGVRRSETGVGDSERSRLVDFSGKEMLPSAAVLVRPAAESALRRGGLFIVGDNSTVIDAKIDTNAPQLI
jgi:hypothetical protein